VPVPVPAARSQIDRVVAIEGLRPEKMIPEDAEQRSVENNAQNRRHRGKAQFNRVSNGHSHHATC
jgi:hypothetical protein